MQEPLYRTADPGCYHPINFLYVPLSLPRPCQASLAVLGGGGREMPIDNHKCRKPPFQLHGTWKGSFFGLLFSALIIAATFYALYAPVPNPGEPSELSTVPTNDCNRLAFSSVSGLLCFSV